ncbi:MAG: GntR family transcriptional regulator [Xanthomonadales bacterium]|jgi:DNA-binding GntR family transcriptional regulator|nr:GntR family transcriptional regulator [Xanthomonadales bacterium]
MAERAIEMPLKSLPEQIAQWLITEISEERLAPGQRITEQFIADRFNVSRGPVRDAFRMVEKTGLVKLLPRRGVVVTPLDAEELEDLFEIRTALMRCVLRRVIRKTSDEQVQALLAGAQELLGIVSEEDRFYAASNALGERFMQLAVSQKLDEFMEPVQLQIMRYRHHGFSSAAARKASAEGFRDLALALIKRDETALLDVLESANARLKAEVLRAFSPRVLTGEEE